MQHQLKRIVYYKNQDMKRSTNFLLLTFIAASLSANASTIKRSNLSSIILKQETQVRNFNGISIGGSIKAFIKIGNEESIRFEGDKEAIAELVTEVKDGVLTIKPKNKWNDWGKRFRDAKISVFITAKKLTSLAMSGSGSIQVESQLASTDLSIVLSGSGSIKTAALTVNSLSAVISGSGNIQISGKASQSNIVLSGSGEFNGKDVNAENLSAKVSGSGSIYVNASKSINAIVTGSGNIYYQGNPAIQKTVVGSGGVRKM